MQNVRKLHRQSSQDKESSPKDSNSSNTTEIGMAVVPKKYNNREGDPHCAVVSSRKHHGNKYQNQRVADIKNDKNVEKEEGRENKDTVKAKDHAKAKEKEKNINKRDTGITIQKDKGVRKDIINSGTHAVRQQHSSPPHRQSKQQQHAHAAAVKESKHHVADTKKGGSSSC